MSDPQARSLITSSSCQELFAQNGRTSDVPELDLEAESPDLSANLDAKRARLKLVEREGCRFGIDLTLPLR